MKKCFFYIGMCLLALNLFGQADSSHAALVLSIADTASRKTTPIKTPSVNTPVSILTYNDQPLRKIKIGGQMVSVLITESDTLIIADLDNVSVSSPRTFENAKDYYRYLKYRRYAAKVYPYAKEAIRIFYDAQYATENLKKRKKKKYLRKLSKELQREFEEPLKGLSKTQGKILVKMIERELDQPMHELIKMTQGKFKAFYWNQSSKLLGYRLKTGYILGQNPILDIVLQDFDISYDQD